MGAGRPPLAVGFKWPGSVSAGPGCAHRIPDLGSRRQASLRPICRLVVETLANLPYIADMLSRARNSRCRPINAPAGFIHPCRPTVVAQPPSGPGWAHELKHDGYRLQIHVRDGRVRLYTITGADW